MAESTSPATALLIIDSQVAFDHPTHWGPSRSNPSYEANVTTLLSAFRSLPAANPPLIIHIAHSSLLPTSPLHPSAPTFAFYPFTTPLPVPAPGKPAELVMTKHVNSALIGTQLESVLREHKIRRLYICGLSTDHCVSTTSRMAANLGVADVEVRGEGGEVRVEKGDVVLVEDATAAWKKPGGEWDAEVVHKVHVESLREFVRIAGTAEVLKEIGVTVEV